jgi:alpha-ketoglutarate-dependent taurine dioxygenase/acyl carrier protein
LKNQKPVADDDLREHLQARLPHYMIPALFHTLDAIPLTPNGKIDRNALPEINSDQDISSSSLNANLSEGSEEEILCHLFADALERQNINTTINFFEFGGHSLSALILLSRIKNTFNVNIEFKEFFENPSVRQIATLIRACNKHEQAPLIQQMTAAERDAGIPLSYEQQRLWFVNQIDGDSSSYNIPAAVRLVGELDISALKESLAYMINRHEILRTSFKLAGKQPVQFVLPSVTTPFNVINLQTVESVLQNTILKKLIKENSKHIFNLEQAPLLKAVLIRLKQDENLLLITMHHIISDAWSIGVLINELSTIYSAITTKEDIKLPTLDIQYTDYAAWQRSYLSEDRLAHEIDFWQQQLHQAQTLVDIPLDKPRPSKQSFKGSRVPFSISPELTVAIQKLCREQGVTPFMALMAIYQIQLHKLSGQNDFCIGVPVANRVLQQTEPLIGFFINSIIIRCDLTENPRFVDLLARIRITSLSAFGHQQLPFDKLLHELKVERNLAYTPFNNARFSFQQTPLKATQIDHLSIIPEEVETEFAKFDLSLRISQHRHEFHGDFMYNSDIFFGETVANIKNQYIDLLNCAILSPQERISDIALLAKQNANHSSSTDKLISKDKKKELLMSNLNPPKSSNPEMNNHTLAEKLLKSKPSKISTNAETLATSQTMTDTGFGLMFEASRPNIDLLGWSLKQTKENIDNLLNQHGFILFRGFDVPGVKSFKQFTKKHSSQLMPYDFGSTPRTKIEEFVYTTTEYDAKQIISQHNEMSYTHTWPMRLFLFCVNSATEGGQTPVCDSELIYNELDKNIVEEFENKQVIYIRNFFHNFKPTWQSAFDTDDVHRVEEYCASNNIKYSWKESGKLYTEQRCQAVVQHPVTGKKLWFNQAHLFHASQLNAEIHHQLGTNLDEAELPRHVYFGDRTKITPDSISHIKHVYEKYLISFDWKKGDVVLLDNMRCTHGRNAFSGKRNILITLADPYCLAQSATV